MLTPIQTRACTHGASESVTLLRVASSASSRARAEEWAKNCDRRAEAPFRVLYGRERFVGEFAICHGEGKQFRPPQLDDGRALTADLSERGAQNLRLRFDGTRARASAHRDHVAPAPSALF